MSTTKDVTCRYFMQGVCREGNRCLFSHDLSTSKPSTICKFYQKGQCAYGTRCRYDHIRPPTSSASGVMGSTRTLHASAPPFYSLNCLPEQNIPITKSKVQEPGKREKKTLVLRDRGCGFGDSSWLSFSLLCPLEGFHMCMAAFEHEMEKAFAIQASQDKVCSICMEVVYDKPSASERRFGILSNCNHTYCLSCIRQWRGVKQFENPIIKSCPECRVISEFVIPSVYWVEDQTKKNELIEAFKQGVGRKACKYFEQGKGTCPFGGRCLYLHAYPDGRRAEPEKPRKQLSSEGTVRFLNSVRLWDFIEDRETRTLPVATGIDDVAEIGELFMNLSGTDAGSTAPP
nr:probable E3 ubiquitin-protein ligase makorin-2 [Pogona vitticeps]